MPKTKLIKELMDDHIAIRGALEKVSALGHTSQEGKKILLQSKELLIKHLKREDNELYPLLNSEAQKNESLKQTLSIFASEMDKITEAAMAFFNKYTLDNTTNSEFSKDYGRLIGTLNIRIRREENNIYPKFEELMGVK